MSSYVSWNYRLLSCFSQGIIERIVEQFETVSNVITDIYAFE
jgi:hypothetical protein